MVPACSLLHATRKAAMVAARAIDLSMLSVFQNNLLGGGSSSGSRVRSSSGGGSSSGGSLSFSSSGSSGSSGAVSSSGAVGNGLGLCVELSLGRTAGHNEGGEGGNEGDLLVHGIYWFW
jgi:hypothetical protein